jgi:carboxypeptidase PM20D1
VVPATATAVVNSRILPGDTVAGVVERTRRVIADSRVGIRTMGAPSEPSPVSDLRSASYRKLTTTIGQILGAGGVIVSPFLVLVSSQSLSVG